MLRNFLKTAYRNLLRKKSYTILNVVGLGIGIGCSIIIYNIISYELSFDKHQSNYDNIYRVYREGESRGEAFKDAGVPFTVSYALRKDYPGIVAGMSNYRGNALFVLNGEAQERKKMILKGMAFVEPEFLDIIDVKFLFGNEKTALSDKGSLVLSRTSAKKLLGLNEQDLHEAVGQVVNYENSIDLTITGIFEDLPERSEFNFSSMISYKSQEDIYPYFDTKEWGTVDSFNFCYILSNPEESDVLEEKFRTLNEKYYSKMENYDVFYRLQPLDDIHFNEAFNKSSESILDKQSLMILTAIVLVLILTSCVNFINLSTALVIVRSKEIGIRKTIGSSKKLLIFQFLTETFLITLLSVFLGLGIAELLNVGLSNMLGGAAQINVLNTPEIIFFIAVLTLIIVLVSGFYPAYVLSRVNPSVVLKTSLKSGNTKGLNIRRALVIFQFVVAQLLIFGTLVLHYQMQFFYNKDLGFEKSSIIHVNIPNRNIEQSIRLKTIIDSRTDVLVTSLNLSSPSGRSNFSASFKYAPLELEEKREANFKLIDENYIDLYGLKLLAGRNIRKTEKKDKILINEKTMSAMGFSNPEEVIGEKLTTEVSDLGATIIGVVANFHVFSLKRQIPYTILMSNPERIRNLSIKVKEETDIKDILSFVDQSWNEIYPDHLYSYNFYDDRLRANYEREENITSLIKVFALITILVGCLGLYGLISFVANQKTKEIGIRKVLGATLMNILNIFSKEVIYLTLIAFLIAAPSGYYLLQTFLEDFYYRIEIGPMFFMVSLSVTLVISVITVGYRSYTTSIQNPVISLKDE